MDANQIYREPKPKGNLSKRSNGISSSNNLPMKPIKNKSKNKIATSRNLLIQQNQKEKNRVNKTSFNEVVDKFKKLFDEKIKFVQDDPIPTTERIYSNKTKKNIGNDNQSGNKIKKTGSTSVLPKKTTNKHGFSELISNIEETLNIHHKIIKNNQLSLGVSEENKGGYSITMPIENYCRNRDKSTKSKIKNSGSISKEKQKNKNKTFSVHKNTDRVRPFQSTQEKKQIKAQESKQRLKLRKSSKNKKQYQFSTDQRHQGHVTLRQTPSINYNSGDLSRAKYRNRLKTFQSQTDKINDITKAKRKTKKNNKSIKQKRKIDQQQIQIKKGNKKIANEPKWIKQEYKQQRPRISKSKEKKKTSYITSERRKMAEAQPKLEFNNMGLKKLVKIKEIDQAYKNNLLNREQQQNILNNKYFHTVSSSSDRADDSAQSEECSSDLQSQEQNQQGSQEQNEQRCERQSQQTEKILGSVIMYDVSQQGDLQFSSKLMSNRNHIHCLSSSNQLPKFQQNKELIKQKWFTQKYSSQFKKYDQIKQQKQNLLKFLSGFTCYLKFCKDKQLLYQFQGDKHINQAKQLAKTDKKEEQVNQPQHQQQKISMKIEQVFKEEEQKWLNLKMSLERIRKHGNFSQELDKVIKEAQLNHLSLKSMQIRQTNYAQQNLAHREKEIINNKYGKVSDNTKTKNGNNEMLCTQMESERKMDNLQKYQQNRQIPHNQNRAIQKLRQSDYIDFSRQIDDDIQCEKTIKGPIRNQGNQINININISDNQIKIKSPFKNYRQKINDCELNSKQSGELTYQIENKIGMNEIRLMDTQICQIIKGEGKKQTEATQFNISRQVINKKYEKVYQNSSSNRQSPKQEYVAESYSISQSQIQMQMLINQFSKPKQHQLKQQQKEIIRNDGHNPVKIEVTNIKNYENQPHFIQEQAISQQNNLQPDKQTINKKQTKTKLSYEQAPLQIKKIFNQQPKKQNELRSRENSNKMLSQDLNLSQLLSAKKEQNNQCLGDKDLSKRIKIFQQIKSPTNHSNNVKKFMNRVGREDLFSNSQSQEASQTHHSQHDSSKKNRIKISLFSNTSQTSHKFHNSQGQLVSKLKTNDQFKQGRIDGTKQSKTHKNFVLIKPKISGKKNQKVKISVRQRLEQIQKQQQNKNIYQDAIKNDLIDIKKQNKSEQQQSESLLICKSIISPHAQNNSQNSVNIVLNKNGTEKKEISEQVEFRIYENPTPLPYGDDAQARNNLQKGVEDRKQKQKSIYSQLLPWLKTDECRQQDEGQLSEEGLHGPPRPSPSNKVVNSLKYQDNGEAEIGKCFVLNKPKYLLSQVDDCIHKLIQQLVDQFRSQMVQCSENKAGKQGNVGVRHVMGEQMQWQYSKIGAHILNYYSMSNINITGENEQQQSEDQEGSPFYRIQRFRDTQSPEDFDLSNTQINIERPIPNNIKLFEQVDEGDSHNNGSTYQQQLEACFRNQGEEFLRDSKQSTGVYTRTDIQYTINLIQSLFQFIKNDPATYADFNTKIRRPLGVDSLSLFRAMRETEQQPSENRPTPDNQRLQQFYPEPQTNETNEQDFDKLYIISIQTLVAFEYHIVHINSLSYQQIFNQSIYDHINSILDKFRPYGLRGLPSLNFEYRHIVLDENNREVIDYSQRRSDPRFNRVLSYQNVVEYTIHEMCENLKIKLGMNSIQVGSQQSIVYSINKFMRQYANELEDQFIYANDGEFLIKYSIMLELEELIFTQEMAIIAELAKKRQTFCSQR